MSAGAEDIERMREVARTVLAERVRRWKATESLQFQYSLKDYTAMTAEEWAAWKRDSAVTNRVARIWGRPWGEGGDHEAVPEPDPDPAVSP